MKKLILASIVASASVFTVLPVYAQVDTDVTVQNQSMDNLINILKNVDADITPEQLKNNLVKAIRLICKNTNPKDLDTPLPTGNCSAAQLDRMMANVINEFGADSPVIADFLAALVAAGVDSDSVTLAAITAGVDATLASEATAAGPGGAPNAPIIVTLPNTPIPEGAGGTGGDDGISEVGN